MGRMSEMRGARLAKATAPTPLAQSTINGDAGVFPFYSAVISKFDNDSDRTRLTINFVNAVASFCT